LASLLTETLIDTSFHWAPTTIRQLANAANSRGGDWQPLVFDLEQIRITESVLAPTSLLFDYLLGSDGCPIKAVAASIEKQWGEGLSTIESESLGSMHGQWSGGDTTVGDRWVAIGHAMCSGRFVEVIDLLAQQNLSVMATRGGAAWIETNRGKLTVRYKEENGKLPARDELGQLWRFPYFLDSLRSVTRTLWEKPHD
jgi:hypothetical protein